MAQKEQKLKAVIAPSLLAADFTQLGNEVAQIQDAGADAIHYDIMDGHFVPNITMGPEILAALTKTCSIDIDCHLMVTHPDNILNALAKAGATSCTVHIEAEGFTKETLRKIKKLGMKAAIAIKPKTMVENNIEEYIDLVDMVLIMTVEPGFGGQQFMPDVLHKVTYLRKKYPYLDIQVDGGLSASTIDPASQAGANVIVAGSAIFRETDRSQMIKTLRDAVERCL